MSATVKTSGYFDSDGVKIYFETCGEGKPIVLVHGFAANIKLNWENTGWVNTLKPLRRVIALDCRGHGRSDKPHETDKYSWTNMARDVVRLMDHLGIEKADLFGYSMGGFISIHLLAFHPERFTSAVVGGIGGLNPTNVEVLTNQVIANALLAEDPSTITDPVGKAFRDFAGLDPINDLKALAAAALTREEKEVTPADLATLNIPVLIAAGGADPLVSEPKKLQAAIPGSRLLVVPGLDHIMFVPNQQFKDAVVSFLKD